MHALGVFFLLLQAVLALLAASYLYYDWKLGAASVPSSSAAGRAVAALVPPDASSVVDLGSGWGGMALAVARAHPQVKVTGIEYALPPYLFSRLRQFFSPALKNLSFLREDLFGYPLAPVSAVICYMPPEMMERLAPKLARELRPGAVVISNSADWPGRTPEKTVEVPALLLAEKIFIYRIAS
ncbi:MAG: class I SAM-dependent methyltransferase [Alphaproteobacteria bacterium]|nr:class I SAM-dependent methyltransferase [Alphaproteobacteria bacterium]MDE2336785.1 class I SAM-dependent methyltransferase [Alphaproteobacteria bacterium]